MKISEIEEADQLEPVEPDESETNPLVWYEAGLAYIKEGKQEDALRVLEKAVELDSALSEAWFNLGTVYSDKQNLKEAEKCFLKSLEYLPDDMKAWENVTVIRLHMRRETDAEKAGKEILRLRENRRVTWATLRAELRKKYLGQGMQLADSKPRRVKVELSTRSDSVVELRTSTYTKQSEIKRTSVVPEDRSDKPTSDTFSSIETLDDSGRCESYFEFAEVYASQEKYFDAISSVRKGLELEPNNVRGLLLLGTLQIYSEKYLEAIEVLTHLVKVDPQNIDVHYLLGKAKMQLGNYFEASKDLYKAVKTQPDDIEVWRELGNSLLKQGRYARASRIFLRALKMNQNDVETLKLFARCQYLWENVERAISVYKKLIVLDKTDPEIWDAYAEALLQHGRFKESKSAKARADFLQTSK